MAFLRGAELFFVSFHFFLYESIYPFDMEPVPPSSAVSAANEALQRNDADYFSSLSQPDIENICKSADEDGR